MFVKELVRILGLTPQEIVTLARSAFGVIGGTVSTTVSAETAAALGVFCADQVTGDSRGLCTAGESYLHLRAACIPKHVFVCRSLYTVVPDAPHAPGEAL